MVNLFIVGTTLSNWLSLIWQNRFNFSIFQIPKVLLITLVILILSPFSLLERFRYHPRIRRIEIEYPPIFILGHFRSGTTHLQELFIKDKRLTYPNALDTVFPHHNIGSEFILRPVLKRVLPDKRPMDNMRFGWEAPNEHDWTMTNLCLLSPYSGAYFPNHLPNYQKYFSFKDASVSERSRFSTFLTFFLKKITYKYGQKSIVMKSPPDTARLKLLAEIFPEAKFVHIYRNPYEVYYSTVKLYLSAQEIYPLHRDKRDIPEFIFGSYNLMHENLYHDIPTISQDNFIEISYEELVKDRVGVMQQIYDKFNLPDFEEVKPRLQEYIDSLQTYMVDDYSKIPDTEKQEIYKRWKYTIEKWGYEKPQQS